MWLFLWLHLIFFSLYSTALTHFCAPCKKILFTLHSHVPGGQLDLWISEGPQELDLIKSKLIFFLGECLALYDFKFHFVLGIGRQKKLTKAILQVLS